MTASPDRQVDLGFVRISYSDTGSGIPILLLHGNPDTRHSWEPIVSLLDDSVRVIAPDFPGFGDSTPLPEDYDVTGDGMVRLWDQFTEAIGLSEPVIVGVHDLGGPWLLPWVAVRPERIAGALILNTVFHRSYPWHSFARIWQLPVLGELSLALMVRPLLSAVMRQGTPGLPTGIVDDTFQRIHATTKATILRFYRAYSDPSSLLEGWEERLTKVLLEVPTEVLWGDRDPFISPEFADRFPGKVRHLPLGHWHHLANPAPVAEALLSLAAKRGTLRTC